MQMTLVSANKLKVEISGDELESLSVDFDVLNSSGLNSRDKYIGDFLIDILDEGRRRTGFSPRGAKLLVEAYENEDGDGCVIYFTALNKRPGDKGASVRPVIYAFPDADALCEGAARIFKKYRHRLLKSSLYYQNEKYQLVVYPLDYSDGLSGLELSEFAARIGEGETLAAYIGEHGKSLISDTAVETLARYFGDSD